MEESFHWKLISLYIAPLQCFDSSPRKTNTLNSCDTINLETISVWYRYYKNLYFLRLLQVRLLRVSAKSICVYHEPSVICISDICLTRSIAEPRASNSVTNFSEFLTVI